MLAAVYRTPGSLEIEDIPVPRPGPGEALIRIDACGVCGTDLKKIAYGLQSGPRIFGHEMAGVIADLGERTQGWSPGDRVALFHHVACGDCFYCERGLDSQCPEYKRTATTAGFEPSGGGFAQVVLASSRAVERGMVRVPESVRLELATFLEPVNTCLKGVRRVGGVKGDQLLVFGLGAIGMLLGWLAHRDGYRVTGLDPLVARRQRFQDAFPVKSLDPGETCWYDDVMQGTAGRGADAAIVAVPLAAVVADALRAVRPGGRVVLFAHTRTGDEAALDIGDLCVHDKEVVGSYSSSMDLVDEAARIVFDETLPVRRLITHRFSLPDINQAIQVASKPGSGNLKVLVRPND